MINLAVEFFGQTDLRFYQVKFSFIRTDSLLKNFKEHELENNFERVRINQNLPY